MVLGVVLACFIILACVALAGTAYAFKGKFYLGVSVSGVDLSGKSFEEGKLLLEERTKKYKEHPIRITLPDISKPKAESPNQYEQLELATTAGEVGLIYEQEKALNAA